MQAIINHLRGVRRGYKPGSYVVLCPFHDDHNPSLLIGPNYGFYCFGCGAHGSLDKLAAALEETKPEYWQRRIERGRQPWQSSWVGEEVESYNYSSETGKLLYQVVRYTPKAFRHRRPHPALKGKWIWKMDGVRRVPYRLPEIIQRSDETILWVEGEKDADTLHRLGFLATTSSGGANSAEHTDLAMLSGRSVQLIPDNDEAGEGYVRMLAGRLVGLGVSTCITRLPATYRDTLVEDITHFVELGAGREEIEGLKNA